MKIKAAVYCRISEDRTGAGLGVQRQAQDCRELAGKLDLDVIEPVYSDNDLSAFTGKRRPRYEDLLADIQAGHVQAVLAWHGDRLHRSPAELERYINICEPRNIATHTVQSGELDLATASGRMTARIIGAVARHESEQKGERISRKMKQLSADGKFTGGRRWFGFTHGSGTELDPVESQAIQRAADDLLAGASLGTIRRAWNETGLLSATGHPWTHTVIRRLFLSKRMSKVLAPDTHAAVRRMLLDPDRLKFSPRSGSKLTRIGGGAFRCYVCERPMHSNGPRYICSDERLPASQRHFFGRNADAIDDYVRKAIRRRLREQGVELLPKVDRAAPLYAELDALHTRKRQIADAFTDGDMDPDDYKRNVKRIKAKIEAADTELSRLTGGNALVGICDADDPGRAFDEVDIDRQRAVLRTLFDVTLLRAPSGRRVGGLYFDPDTVLIEYKGVEQGG